MAQSADLVKYLTQVHYELTRAGHADGSPEAKCSGMAANIRHEQARWRRDEKALRDAEMAQQSRQAWLDEHPETVHHLDGLRARAPPGPPAAGRLTHHALFHRESFRIEVSSSRRWVPSRWDLASRAVVRFKGWRRVIDPAGQTR